MKISEKSAWIACALISATHGQSPEPRPSPIYCLPGVFGSADTNIDGDIGPEDYAFMPHCLGGPDASPLPDPPTTPEFCTDIFNRDLDSDVDLRDVRTFFNRYTGPCTGLGHCPPRMHLMHRSGQSDLINPDTEILGDIDSREYLCVVDELTCGETVCKHGQCVLLGGESTCACKPGYVGQACDQCDIGYQRGPDDSCVLGDECRTQLCSGNGDCRELDGELVCVCDERTAGRFCELGGHDDNMLRPPARVFIEGTDSSVGPGELRPLAARAVGGGVIDPKLQMTLIHGPGQLSPNPAGGGWHYIAPDDLADHTLAVLQVCSFSFPDACTLRFLTLDPRGGIASTGQSNATFAPFDEVMRTFMRHRCIGAAVLGISVFGEPVYTRGYGNLNGAPTNDPDYLEACGDVFDISDHVPGFNLPGPAPTQPNSPFRIGSISKSVGAAVFRDVVKTQILPGPDPTDADVEALLLCSEPDLMPAGLFDVMCNGADPPVPLGTISGFFPDCAADDPCPYGGTCSPLIPPNTIGICAGCPAGFGGFDCSINLASCPDMTDAADARWQNVNLGHIMGHRSGLPRSIPDNTSIILPNMEDLRGYSTQSHWALDEILLASDSGFPAGTFASEFPEFPDANVTIGSDGYFIRRTTVFEAFMTRLGACMLYPPGGPVPSGYDNYSNTAFAFVGAMAEHISGIPFAGETGKPGQHSGSLLETFAFENMGLPIPGQATGEGIFTSQGAFRLRETREPIYRGWSTQRGGTYYPTQEDEKRPYCIWDGSDCQFTDFADADPRFNWDFFDSVVLEGYAGGEFDGAPTAGSLATEAEVFLRFMGKYWVGGSGNNPKYGETRCPGGDCAWNSSNGHNGAAFGTWAEAKQLGGPPKLKSGSGDDITCAAHTDCPNYTACAGTPQQRTKAGYCLGGKCYKDNEYRIPPIDPCSGKITDDFANLECHSCRLPIGVDFFVSLNQRADKKCAENDDYTCDEAYGRVVDFMLHAVCQTQWPPNPYVIWPPVFKFGDSGLTGPSYSVGDRAPFASAGPAHPDRDTLVAAGLECCGNGELDDEDEECDGTHFGGLSCASFGYTMGSLTCGPLCQVSVSGCSGGIGLPPGTYAACGYDAEACNFDPSQCNANGDCLGGPCARTTPGDFEYAYSDPFNVDGGEFHPDGDFRDQHGNLYFCRDNAGEGEMVCVAEGAWGVCRRCEDKASELTTRIGCQCTTDQQCDGAEPGLICYGEEFGSGPGFCWDAGDGPPQWQCAEGICGMAAWYGDANMYCEHYSISGQARCEPWHSCNGILARVCAGEDLICEEFPGSCTTDDCCAVECQQDSHCGEAFGWPNNYECTPQLTCEQP